MARRSEEKYEGLSPAYKSRLERRGIGKAEYLSGASLREARGHSASPTKGPRGSERFQQVVRYGDRYGLVWPNRMSTAEAVQSALASGISLAEIERAIHERKENTDEYRRTGSSPRGSLSYGRFENEEPELIDDDDVRGLYWYH